MEIKGKQTIRLTVLKEAVNGEDGKTQSLLI